LAGALGEITQVMKLAPTVSVWSSAQSIVKRAGVTF
jgi:hypothetical protein